MIVFLLSVSAPPAVSFTVPPITTLGACWNVPYFSFSSSLLASFPPSFFLSFFLIPYDDRCLRRLHTVDTTLWHSSKWSSFQPITQQKQVTGGSVRVCGCTFASSLVFQIKDSALKATSSKLLTPLKTSL